MQTTVEFIDPTGYSDTLEIIDSDDCLESMLNGIFEQIADPNFPGYAYKFTTE
jgi:hypothetical protein